MVDYGGYMSDDRQIRDFPSAETIAALNAMFAAESTLRRAQSRPTLKRLCEEARAMGLQCEAVVLYLKRVWRTLPDAGQNPTRDDLIAAVISDCIAEFYRDTNGDR